MPNNSTLHPVLMESTFLFMTMIMTPEMNAAMDPTDKSMPPAMMTKVAPTAMMPMNALRARTLVTLAADRKLGFTQAPSATRSTSAHKGPHFFQSKRVATVLAGGSASSSRCMAPRSLHARGVAHDLLLVEDRKSVV